MGATTRIEIESSRRVNSRANQYDRMGWVSERDARQIIDSHPGGDGDRRDLDDIDRPLADDVAPQYLASLAIDDQFAKTERTSVDYHARRVEIDNCCDDVVGLMGLGLAEADLGVFRIVEASYRTDMGLKRQSGTLNGVGRSNEPVLDRLGNQHQPASDVASGEGVGGSGRRLSRICVD